MLEHNREVAKDMNTDDLSALIENSPDRSWVSSASCGDIGLERLDLFFVDAGRTLSSEAMAICRFCEVRRDCLQHAYANEIAGGYFGGVSPVKRRTLDLDAAMAVIEDEPGSTA
ncbi:MAG: WhiB family transcriptional regulator [Ilumatobacter sp.]|uniref:WhiB family transcriptional regulator n=1 Tax=Ilumatobacter sp. TaxID=1967498 RepID=UPI0026313E16|nr:WhiB family transcriptional regulator [Ilumatobacter sp.]MDJ0767442.1 WhiB family transcriptional regulator [Ilumatobacter sp.]